MAILKNIFTFCFKWLASYNILTFMNISELNSDTGVNVKKATNHHYSLSSSQSAAASDVKWGIIMTSQRAVNSSRYSTKLEWTSFQILPATLYEGVINDSLHTCAHIHTYLQTQLVPVAFMCQDNRLGLTAGKVKDPLKLS